MSRTISVKILDFGSPEHAASIALRHETLRKPLSLTFLKEELDAEQDQIHLAAFEEGRLTGIMLLKKLNNSIIKMRQVAVDEKMQGTGTGTKMVEHAENYARDNGYSTIELHARNTAVPFYLRLGYITEGPEFEEVGIPHTLMVKHL